MLHKILKLGLAFLLAIIFSVTTTPGKLTKAETIAVINTPVLNVREGPGLSYGRAAQVKQGEKYTIIDRNNEWVKLQLSSGKTGWVASWLIKENQSTSSPTTSSSTVVSTVDGLRFRSGPGTSFQVIGSLNKGNEAKFLEANENWSKISFNGHNGWVSSQFITAKQSSGSTNSNSNSGSNSTTTKKTGTITASILNVRDQPNLQGRIIGKLKQNANVTITNEREVWLEIVFGGSSAWIHRDFVAGISSTEEKPSQPAAPQTPTNQGKIGVVTASSLNVRDSSSLSGKVIGSLKQGNKVTIEEEVNNWSHITLSNGTNGWVASWYLDIQLDTPTTEEPSSGKTAVKILYNGTNIRSGSSTSHSVVARGNEGDSFTMVAKEGDWYKINLPGNKIGYVAGWLVSVNGTENIVERPGVNQYLKGKTIVIDPGHGGNDSGAIGVSGTYEKTLNLRTARMVVDKLNASGANVVMTRNSDNYVSLRSRVSISHYRNADAFVSIHYDSTYDRNVRGVTSYYYKNIDVGLASTLQSELVKNTGFKNRQHRQGNYQVLRENRNPSVLLELGFISNPTEEYTVSTNTFQENVSNGIYYGLAQYFKGK
ncbi:N-acetylmuramoyl-L-alanine amidase [Bacillus sp. HNG]|uniref:SH3 domain-containing protein n=1 Tax=Bacillus sp. HNG TaxID=2293325 RepID=UPI000E2FC153|nr:SH3 domain-containing protein [Bacillus sp. HNG]RFB17645.1 N-acetylmuramoyl-L-alanine amidase [Bacillus sp. HNG]